MCYYIKNYRMICFCKYCYCYLFSGKKGAGGWFCELPFVVFKNEIPFGGGYLALYINQSIQSNAARFTIPRGKISGDSLL